MEFSTSILSSYLYISSITSFYTSKRFPNGNSFILFQTIRNSSNVQERQYIAPRQCIFPEVFPSLLIVAQKKRWVFPHDALEDTQRSKKDHSLFRVKLQDSERTYSTIEPKISMNRESLLNW